MRTPQPPLRGTQIVSVGHTLPGLYCLAMLRDLGADVFRVERVSRARAGDSDPYAALTGQLQFPTRSLLAGTSVCELNLHDPRGRDAFRAMASRADVVIEGFRPGVAARLGIDYESLAAEHPALVYASISGYGQEGPLRRRVGHDLNYLAETGVLGLANPIGLPGTTFADGLAGVAGALNVVAALHAASRSGAGQYLDLAIVDGPLFLLSSELELYWQSGQARGPGDTHLTGRYPWYAVHETADGARIATGAVEAHFHAALCRGLGHEELASQQFADGAASETFAAEFAARTREEVEELFEGEDVCVSAVRSIDEVAESPLGERARRTEPGGRETLVRSPVRLGIPPLAAERSTAAVLEHFGLAPDEIEALRGESVAGSD